MVCGPFSSTAHQLLTAFSEKTDVSLAPAVNFFSFSTAVTLKIRSESPKSN